MGEVILGDYKIVKRFAWLPQTINGKTVWLKKYMQLYEYREVEVVFFENNYGRRTYIEKWELVGQKVI